MPRAIYSLFVFLGMVLLNLTGCSSQFLIGPHSPIPSCSSQFLIGPLSPIPSCSSQFLIGPLRLISFPLCTASDGMLDKSLATIAENVDLMLLSTTTHKTFPAEFGGATERATASKRGHGSTVRTGGHGSTYLCGVYASQLYI